MLSIVHLHTINFNKYYTKNVSKTEIKNMTYAEKSTYPLQLAIKTEQFTKMLVHCTVYYIQYIFHYEFVYTCILFTYAFK